MARKASPKKALIRMAMCGVGGSGKTYSSLAIATEFLSILKGRGLCHGNQKIAVLDAERGRSEMYAKEDESDTYGFSFDVEILKKFTPHNYMEGIYKLEREGYPIIIIDQITYEWSGTGGCLSQHGDIVKSKGERYSYFAWRDITPMHDSFIEAIMASTAHVLCCVRARSKCVYDKETKTVEEVGLRPIQRKDAMYDFDVCAMMNQKHEARFFKSKCPQLDGLTLPLPGRNVAELLAEWTLRGSGSCKAPETMLPSKYKDEIESLFKKLSASSDSIRRAVQKRGVASGRIEDLSVDSAIEMLRVLSQKVGSQSISDQISESLASGSSVPVPEVVGNGTYESEKAEA